MAAITGSASKVVSRVIKHHFGRIPNKHLDFSPMLLVWFLDGLGVVFQLYCGMNIFIFGWTGIPNASHATPWSVLVPHTFDFCPRLNPRPSHLPRGETDGVFVKTAARSIPWRHVSEQRCSRIFKFECQRFGAGLSGFQRIVLLYKCYRNIFVCVLRK